MSFHRSTASRVRAALRRNERGIALPMVLVVFLVGFALVGAFLVAIVGSAQVSNTTRSGIQAQAAAEAGVEAAKVALVSAAGASTNFCSSFPVVTSVAPHYEVTGVCDNASSPTSITLESTSVLADGTTARVQAVLPVNAGSSAQNTAGGPSIVFANSFGSLSNYSLDAVNSEVEHQDFYVRTGDIACWNSGTYSHSFYLYSGRFTNGQSCTVNGNIYAKNGVTLQGTVNGDIVSHNAGGDIIYESAKVNGDFWSKGTLSPLQAPVSGNVTLAGSGSSTFQNKAAVGKNLVHKGPVSGASSRVTGTISQLTSPSVPDFPEIQPWQDVSFEVVTNAQGVPEPPAAWKQAGYSLEVVTDSACNVWQTYTVNPASALANQNSPKIFDLRGCGDFGFDTNNTSEIARKTVSVKTDIAFVTNKWRMSGTQFKSADGQPHTIHFITPDGNPNLPGPQCNSPAGESTLINATTVDPKLAIYLYTPCTMNFNGNATSSTFRGQVYAGTVTFNGGVKMAFAPRSIPGYDFATGASPSNPGQPTPGGSSVPTLLNGISTAPTSQRNIE